MPLFPPFPDEALYRANQDKALQKFRSGLAAISATGGGPPVNIIFTPGSSITEGDVYAGSRDDHWTTLVGNYFRQKYLTGAAALLSSRYLPTVHRVTMAADWTYTNVTPASSNPNYGLGLKCHEIGGTTKKITRTMEAAVTSVDVYYVKSTSGLGSINISIDGGAPTVISSTGTARGGYVTNIPMPNDGLTHTFEISPASATIIRIEGVYPYRGDEAAGIRVFEGGVSGTVIHSYVINGTHQIDTLATIAATGPTLLIAEMGVNDFPADTAWDGVSGFDADFVSLLGSYRAAAPSMECAFRIYANRRLSVGVTRTWDAWCTHIQALLLSPAMQAYGSYHLIDERALLPDPQSNYNVTGASGVGPYPFYDSAGVHPQYARSQATIARNVVGSLEGIRN